MPNKITVSFKFKPSNFEGLDIIKEPYNYMERGVDKIKGYTYEEMNELLEKHRMWLFDEEGGIRADLSNADLKNEYLRYMFLMEADLRCADLRGADLRHINLSGADMRGADLRNADLEYADLSNADLRGTNLGCTDSECANLIACNLTNIFTDSNTKFCRIQCPENGSFIGYKKCRKSKIVKLLIPEDAKRSSAASRKCRCSKAKILSITDLDGNELGEYAVSYYDKRFIYRVGENVEVTGFCEDRWQEWAEGIHFFMTRQEAVEYGIP